MTSAAAATPCPFIRGQWRSSGPSFAVVNPATGDLIATGASATVGDVDDAVSAARIAFREHSAATVAERAGWCHSAADAVVKATDFLAAELSREHGKPLAEARGEVAFAAMGWRAAAQHACATPDTSPQVADARKRVLVRRRPRGVWAVFTPWNFPVNIPVEYLGPAIATGNAAVWKPAPSTTRIAALFFDVLRSSAIPEGLLQLVVTQDVEVARHLTTHPGVDAIGFTGGSATGRMIQRSTPEKHHVLELGGNTAIVVHSDADLGTAAPAIASAAFWNGGQVCSAAGKILAPRSAAGDLAEALAVEADRVVVGDPFDSNTTMGPQHLRSGIDRVQRLVDDAVDRGARLLAGGQPLPGPGTYYPPTVLADVPQGAAIFGEETFGPVAAVTTVDSDDDLVHAANAGTYGLCAAVFTNSLDRAFSSSEAIEAGLVVVNDTSNWWEYSVPFGGAPGRDSGRGRIGGAQVLTEFTQVSTIAIQVG